MEERGGPFFLRCSFSARLSQLQHKFAPPSELLTSVAFRRRGETQLLEVKTTSGIRPPTRGESTMLGGDAGFQLPRLRRAKDD